MTERVAPTYGREGVRDTAIRRCLLGEKGRLRAGSAHRERRDLDGFGQREPIATARLVALRRRFVHNSLEGLPGHPGFHELARRIDTPLFPRAQQARVARHCRVDGP